MGRLAPEPPLFERQVLLALAEVTPVQMLVEEAIQLFHVHVPERSGGRSSGGPLHGVPVLDVPVRPQSLPEVVELRLQPR